MCATCCRFHYSSSASGTNSNPCGPFKLLMNGVVRPVGVSTIVSWFKLPTEANSVLIGTLSTSILRTRLFPVSAK